MFTTHPRRSARFAPCPAHSRSLRLCWPRHATRSATTTAIRR
jgi:hypothetical protein